TFHDGEGAVLVRVRDRHLGPAGAADERDVGRAVAVEVGRDRANARLGRPRCKVPDRIDDRTTEPAASGRSRDGNTSHPGPGEGEGAGSIAVEIAGQRLRIALGAPV